MADTALYSTIATYIIKAQFSVIGPLAVDQAKRVDGVIIDTSMTVTIKGNGKEILDSLVKQFELLFGRASVEVCKDAIREIQPTVKTIDLPEILH